MLSLRELLAYGSAFLEEEQTDSGGEFDTPHLTDVISPPASLTSLGPVYGSCSSSLSSTPTLLMQPTKHQRPVTKPVFLCQEHLRKITIEVSEPEETPPQGSMEMLLLRGEEERSYVSEGTQTESGRLVGRKEAKERRKESRRQRKEEQEAEQYRKLSVQEAEVRKLSQQYEVVMRTS